MSALRTALRDAEFSLGRRDESLPCLPVVLDDGRLSEVLGEPVRVTRVRYKPGTSALVAFCRTRDGKEEYGWALTTAGNVKLHRRAQKSALQGGGVLLVSPSRRQSDAIIAVGGIEDDWTLSQNLRWLEDRGLEGLGAGERPGRGLLSGSAKVLRYKPERRLVLLVQSPDAPIVIKTAALPAPGNVERFHQRLQQQGVPVLPMLGDADSFGHGTSASPAWGDQDLAASNDPEAARRAGESLARLHGIRAEAESGPGPGHEALVERQLAATCAMVTALVPVLEVSAAKVAARIHRRLEELTDGRTRVLVHGDFSADQVLVSGAEVRLIDFDRAGTGAPESDLGSFAAVEEMSRWRGTSAGRPRTGDLINGYVLAGGRFTPAATDTWAALRLFAGSVDPFRDRSPDWAADMSRHIDRACELVP